MHFLRSLALVLAIPLASGLATCRAVHQVTDKGLPEPRAAGTPRFTPPANGELSAAQIEMFLRVRPHEQAILKQPGGDPPEAEVRAAREAGVEPEEYRWVKERIARAVLVRYRIAYRDLGRGRMMRDLILARSVVGDPVARGEIARQIEAVQNGEPVPDTPALRHNVDLVARNQERLVRGEGLSEIRALLSGRLPKTEASAAGGEG
jgi:hypothetical protein